MCWCREASGLLDSRGVPAGILERAAGINPNYPGAMILRG